ncbi:MAG: tetratricopeptide repeat protein, partial [Sandaracinaceae bacterium]
MGVRGNIRGRTLSCAVAVGLAVAALGSAPARAQEDASLDQAVVLFQRAEQRFRLGDYETAATLLREAIALEPAPPLYFNLGRALEELGDLRGAREAYESFLELAPEHPERATVEARVVELTAAEARADAEAARAREEAEARAAAEAEAEAAREAPPLAPPSPDA